MGNLENVLQELTDDGKGFNYDNFALKSEFGYPSILSADWITWTARIVNCVERHFEKQSAPARIIRSAQQIVIIGNDRSHFDAASSYYKEGLSLALSTLKEDKYAEILERGKIVTGPQMTSNKVFVVHGHDDDAKKDLEILLTEMGLQPVVLHRQPDGGRTLIEKFEHYADVGYAFILATPDDIAYLSHDDLKPDDGRGKEYRARQNVIFEFGFFVGRLGRGKTCCLYRSNVTLPSDLAGLIYKKFDRKVEEIAWSIQKELRAVGYKI